ncbi:putative NAD kinase 3 isoform X5 [Carya illinoinensis]|uniref:putative NAD kinase 3 isoform X5 n=1 Tax=Carya illinoinensis TaxID=32201 RepID=UPI001C71B4E1|nr:putative NAD kinase 3 isoform X5 [Carya illinoinensis]
MDNLRKRELVVMDWCYMCKSSGEIVDNFYFTMRCRGSYEIRLLVGLDLRRQCLGGWWISLQVREAFKASFELSWCCKGEQSDQHKHYIVSFERGNIITAERSSKQISLRWKSHPQIVLILTKPNSISVQVLCRNGQVPGILICPHSLSFRPLILTEHVTLRVQVPFNSRGHAWASFDGKDGKQLTAGNALVCSMAPWPVPTACLVDSTSEFLCSIHEDLHWNLRKTQSFDGPRDS